MKANVHLCHQNAGGGRKKKTDMKISNHSPEDRYSSYCKRPTGTSA